VLRQEWAAAGGGHHPRRESERWLAAVRAVRGPHTLGAHHRVYGRPDIHRRPGSFASLLGSTDLHKTPHSTDLHKTPRSTDLHKTPRSTDLHKTPHSTDLHKTPRSTDLHKTPRDIRVAQGAADSGHYYSYAKDGEGKWYEFNDSTITAISEADLEKAFGGAQPLHGGGGGRGFYSNFNSSASAYMLMYRRLDATVNINDCSQKDLPAKLSVSFMFLAWGGGGGGGG
jgi:hypothetical protein